MATTAPETTQDVRGDGADRIGLSSATGDFYDIASLLSEEDSQIVGRVRAFAGIEPFFVMTTGPRALAFT